MRTIDQLFKRNLKQAIKQGLDYQKVNCLCGATERKIVLTQAEAEAGKQTWSQFMGDKMWDLAGDSWMFGSPETNLNIGLVPIKLAQQRLGLNRHCWDSYLQIS